MLFWEVSIWRDSSTWTVIAPDVSVNPNVASRDVGFWIVGKSFLIGIWAPQSRSCPRRHWIIGSKDFSSGSCTGLKSDISVNWNCSFLSESDILPPGKCLFSSESDISPNWNRLFLSESDISSDWNCLFLSESDIWPNCNCSFPTNILEDIFLESSIVNGGCQIFWIFSFVDHHDIAEFAFQLVWFQRALGSSLVVHFSSNLNWCGSFADSESFLVW